MADLKPDARALIRAGQTAFRPQPSDRERVLQSLTRTLGEGATVGAAHRTQPPAGVVGKSAVRSWVLGGLGAVAVSAGVVLAAHPWTRATPTSARAAAPMASSIPAPEPALAAALPSLNAEDLPLEPQGESPPSLQRSGPRPSVAHPPLSALAARADSLPEEVSLLSKAEQQLSAGHADEALRTLGEHERRFPSGALAEERLAARVQALCALGRVAEARPDLTKLGRTYPGSAHFDRARRFCGIDTP